MISLRYFSWVLFSVCLTFGEASWGLVSGAAGEEKGKFNFEVSANFLGGEMKPSNDPALRQETDIDQYNFKAGYTFGDVGFLRDFYLELGASTYNSREEVVGNTIYHPRDKGTIFSLAVAANLIHDFKSTFGFFLKGSVPSSMDLGKFANPRIDTFALGTTFAHELTPGFNYEAQIYLGTGASGSSGKQNGMVALSNLLHFWLENWAVASRLGVRMGPFFEGDIAERFDTNYNPTSDASDAIRTLRFGVAFLPYVRLSELVLVEFGYVQKFFGHYNRNSKDFSFAIKLTI